MIIHLSFQCVHLEFEHFDVKCGDSVDVYDGAAHLFSVLCGRNPPLILATGPTVLLKFLTNDITEGTGFHLRYELRGTYLHIVKWSIMYSANIKLFLITCVFTGH